jgi:glycosyltransferase involved in cell wall biosynthesis
MACEGMKYAVNHLNIETNEQIMTSTPKHVLLISNTAFSMWNFRRSVMADMVAEGCKVTCIAVPDHTSDNIKTLGVDFIPLSLTRAGANPFHEINVIRFIFSHIKKLKPDLIISYTIKPNAYVPPIAKLLGIPCLAVVTGLGYAFIKDNFVARLARYVLRFGLNCTQKIWFLNHDDRHVVCRESPFLWGKSSILAGEGIDINYFSDKSFPLPSNDKFIFLMVARILKDKGIYEFAEAAKIIRQKKPQVECHVLGAIDHENPAGLSTDEWQKLCDESGVIYKGVSSDVRPFIAAAHVCVLPSYREGIPFALLEGGAMRKPLIATDVAGCRDVVRNGQNGYVVEVQNAHALADAMQKMIDLPHDSFVKMKDISRQIIVDEFCTEKVIEQYRKLYIN